MNPTPAKPRIIIAQVLGSGTAEVTDDPFWAMASSGANSISSPPKLKVPKPPHPFPHGIDVVKLSVKRGAETAVALMPPVPMLKFTPAWNPAEVPPTVSSTPSKPVEASPPNVVSVRSWVWLLIVMLVGENAVPGDLRDWFAESPVNVPFDVSKVNTTEKLSPARLPPPNKFSPSVLELTPPTEELTLEIVPLYVTLTMSADAADVRPTNAATAAMHFKEGKFIEDPFNFELRRHDESRGNCIQKVYALISRWVFHFSVVCPKRSFLRFKVNRTLVLRRS
jgi:hypothetical protein